MNAAVLVIAQDLVTLACGFLNAGYFIDYWWGRNGPRARRIGAAALALVSAAAVVEALFSQALFWAQEGNGPLGQPSDGAWALVRLPLFASTVLISFLILRGLRA